MPPTSVHDELALLKFFPAKDGLPLQYKAFEKNFYRARLPWDQVIESIPTPLQGPLKEQFFHRSLRVVSVQGSPEEEAVKFLLETPEGHRVESVLIFQNNRTTLCVSSQVGCSLGCLFCATARLGFKRNLWYFEILDQLDFALEYLAEQGLVLKNLVFMGMGEPLLNYLEVSKALRILMDQRKFSLAPRRITISTAGIVPQIRQLARDFPRVSLALSLHSPVDKIRAQLMPVATTWNLKTLFSGLDEYTKNTGNRIFYEYIMIAGITDSQELLPGLIELLKNRPAHLNLIPYNKEGDSYPDSETGEWVPRPTPWGPSPREVLDQFQAALKKAGIPTTVRNSKGAQIAAACGQLVNRVS